VARDLDGPHASCGPRRISPVEDDACAIAIEARSRSVWHEAASCGTKPLRFARSLRMGRRVPGGRAAALSGARPCAGKSSLHWKHAFTDNSHMPRAPLCAGRRRGRGRVIFHEVQERQDQARGAAPRPAASCAPTARCNASPPASLLSPLHSSSPRPFAAAPAAASPPAPRGRCARRQARSTATRGWPRCSRARAWSRDLGAGSRDLALSAPRDLVRLRGSMPGVRARCGTAGRQV